jgi:hypothetical protein
MRRMGQGVAVALLLLTVAACGAEAGSPVATPASSARQRSTPAPSPSAIAKPAATALPEPTLLPQADDATMMVSSRYPYRIWIPTDWEPGSIDAADAFYGPAGQQVDVRYYPSISEQPDAWFAKARGVLEGFAPIDGEGEAIHAAGTAHFYQLHPAANDQELTLYRLVVMDGTDAWDLTWVSPAGNESSDVIQFQTIANTFWPTGKPLNIWRLAVGDCFQSLPLGEPSTDGVAGVFLGPVDGFARVDCGAPHTGEVIAALPELEAECEGTFEPYVGRALAGSALGLWKAIPLQRSDLPAGTAALCIVSGGASSTGTARGSAR